MCGLLGAFWKCPPSDAETRLGDGVVALRHRGPDDRGYTCIPVADGLLALGHTRLSIIDLSSGGHQPMRSAGGRYLIVFNGEIYNYRELRDGLCSLGHFFYTDSDTEVLLAAWVYWGKGCLSRLRGMFAFVVYDSLELTLTCVRDPFGIKPLFYRYHANEFFFASEPGALFKLSCESPGLNLQRAYDYLVWNSYDDQENTFFEGIKHLMPGHHLTFQLSAGLMEPDVSRWWWPSIEERRDLSFSQATEQLREMFLTNIRLHLRSDVSLGAALSGGVDSSAVVCAIRHVEPSLPIHTFSYVARGAAVNEECWADLVNSHVGAIAHKVVVSPEEMARDLDEMIVAQGEPFGSTSIYAQYRVFQLAKERGVRVTLDGQGADELLAGYQGYPRARMRSLLENGEIRALIRFFDKWTEWPGRSRESGILNLASLFVPERLRPVLLALMGRNRNPQWLNKRMLQERGVKLKALYPEMLFEASGRRLMETLRAALVGYGLGSLLRHGDRNSMHWSIESRVPFLTSDIAEFLLSLPEDYLVSSQGETKRIFRAAMRGIVPDAILNRRDKIGFETPEHQWLQALGAKNYAWMEGVEGMPFLETKSFRMEVQDVIEGKRPLMSQTWRMLNFCRWMQACGVSLR